MLFSNDIYLCSYFLLISELFKNEGRSIANSLIKDKYTELN